MKIALLMLLLNLNFYNGEMHKVVIMQIASNQWYLIYKTLLLVTC